MVPDGSRPPRTGHGDCRGVAARRVTHRWLRWRSCGEGANVVSARGSSGLDCAGSGGSSASPCLPASPPGSTGGGRAGQAGSAAAVAADDRRPPVDLLRPRRSPPRPPQRANPISSTPSPAHRRRATPTAVGAPADRPWVEPLDDGSCPASHPVKVNETSGIYHVPGGRFYDRTVAGRCYASAGDASADGYRPAKA